jgi:hypothetical protein
MQMTEWYEQAAAVSSRKVNEVNWVTSIPTPHLALQLKTTEA